MRITNRMISNNFLDNLNSSRSSLVDLSEKVSSERSYMRVSDDPATALKAMNVRQNLSRTALYKSNVAAANDIMTDVESSFAEINSLLVEIKAKVSQGKSDTSNETDRDIIAKVLRNYQDEILNIANSRFSDKYIFGGSDIGQQPFALNAGVLEYHGMDVNNNAGFDEHSIYYDVGLGLELNGATGEVVPGTGFNISHPGSVVFGTGVDGDGITNNIYNLIGDIAQMFEDNNMTNIEAYAAKLEDISNDVVVQYADIGQKTDFLDFLTDRFETSEFNGQTKQSRLEGLDTAKGIVEYSAQEAAYNAALAMGGKILQPTLLDYMR